MKLKQPKFKLDVVSRAIKLTRQMDRQWLKNRDHAMIIQQSDLKELVIIWKLGDKTLTVCTNGRSENEHVGVTGPKLEDRIRPRVMTHDTKAAHERLKWFLS